MHLKQCDSTSGLPFLQYFFTISINQKAGVYKLHPKQEFLGKNTSLASSPTTKQGFCGTGRLGRGAAYQGSCAVYANEMANKISFSERAVPPPLGCNEKSLPSLATAAACKDETI